jgi:hypothetical protein
MLCQASKQVRTVVQGHPGHKEQCPLKGTHHSIHYKCNIVDRNCPKPPLQGNCRKCDPLAVLKGSTGSMKCTQSAKPTAAAAVHKGCCCHKFRIKSGKCWMTTEMQFDKKPADGGPYNLRVDQNVEILPSPSHPRGYPK